MGPPPQVLTGYMEPRKVLSCFEAGFLITKSGGGISVQLVPQNSYGVPNEPLWSPYCQNCQ